MQVYTYVKTKVEHLWTWAYNVKSKKKKKLFFPKKLRGGRARFESTNRGTKKCNLWGFHFTLLLGFETHVKRTLYNYFVLNSLIHFTPHNYHF